LRVSIASGRRAACCTALAFIFVAGGCARASGGEGVEWGTSLHQALSASTRDRMPVFVYYAHDWDHWCHRMESETFRDPGVRSALRGYHLVRIDPDKDPDDTNKYDVYLCPSFIILDHRGEEMYHAVGFRTPTQMMRDFTNAREHPNG